MVIAMSCFTRQPEGTNGRLKTILKLVDSLTLQLKRAPFHVIADAITLATLDVFDSADLVELYVVDDDHRHVSLMSQSPQLDQEAFPPQNTLDKGSRLSEVIRTREPLVLQSGEMYPERSYQCSIVVPWIQQSSVEGLLIIHSKTRSALHTADLAWLQLIAALTNTFSLSTKISNEIRKNRRSSVVPLNILRSSLTVQKYQSSGAQSMGASDMQDSRILE